MITLEDIKRANSSLKGIVHYTPLDISKTFSTLSNNIIHLKLENLQKTGSFKVRGAYNKILSLTDQERVNGVIAASAGNHAQGVAFSSTKAGIKSTIVMPIHAPIAKIEATKKYGAEVILHGDSFDDALDHAEKLQRENGKSFIHAFNDSKIIEGQGTIGLELLEQLPDLDAVVCPIGGGGLIAGIACAIKSLKPSVKIYGVQAANCPSMISSIQNNAPKKVATVGSIADGIAVKQPGDLTFKMVQTYVDDLFVVDDREIARTMLYLLERGKLLVEGSGAVALAALLYKKIKIEGKKVAAIISGGNIDINFVSRIIESGLVEAGRYLSISTIVPDKPGFLQQLLKIIASEKANVISINHHRISTKVLPGQTEIELSLETRDQKHIDQIVSRLRQEGYDIMSTM